MCRMSATMPGKRHMRSRSAVRISALTQRLCYLGCACHVMCYISTHRMEVSKEAETSISRWPGLAVPGPVGDHLMV